VPVQRSMVLEFVEDPTCHYLDKQYMFGESLLVAPVYVFLSWCLLERVLIDDEIGDNSFHESEASFYIPAGIWTSFWDPKETITGPCWVKQENVPFDT
jgi:alpha-glucosidase (family GH31 glycosyl hydrolase)